VRRKEATEDWKKRKKLGNGRIKGKP